AEIGRLRSCRGQGREVSPRWGSVIISHCLPRAQALGNYLWPLRGFSSPSAFVVTAVLEVLGPASYAGRGVQPATPEEGPMSEPQKLPAGWDEERVRDVLAHYEGQTEDEQADELEAAL